MCDNESYSMCPSVHTASLCLHAGTSEWTDNSRWDLLKRHLTQLTRLQTKPITCRNLFYELPFWFPAQRDGGGLVGFPPPISWVTVCFCGINRYKLSYLHSKMGKYILNAIWAADNIMEIHKVYARVYGEGDELWWMLGEGWGFGGGLRLMTGFSSSATGFSL